MPGQGQGVYEARGHCLVTQLTPLPRRGRARERVLSHVHGRCTAVQKKPPGPEPQESESESISPRVRRCAAGRGLCTVATRDDGTEAYACTAVSGDADAGPLHPASHAGRHSDADADSSVGQCSHTLTFHTTFVFHATFTFYAAFIFHVWNGRGTTQSVCASPRTRPHAASASSSQKHETNILLTDDEQRTCQAKLVVRAAAANDNEIRLFMGEPCFGNHPVCAPCSSLAGQGRGEARAPRDGDALPDTAPVRCRRRRPRTWGTGLAAPSLPSGDGGCPCFWSSTVCSIVASLQPSTLQGWAASNKATRCICLPA